MARTKGALNKRTRAALHAAQTGELGRGGISPIDYLLKVMRDSDKPDALRIEAAKSVAPYLQPKLSAVELNTPDPLEGLSREDIINGLKSSLSGDPAARAMLVEILKADGEVNKSAQP